MVRLEDIIDKVAAYSAKADLDVIKKAYVFSAKVHAGQTRRSGEPYLIHPLEVASILAGLKMDVSVVATGLLHDTVEDTHASIEEIEEMFGEEVGELVDGLTKISKITFDRREDHEAENFRKMILAMAKDIRVVLIKLADRLHNMRTLSALSEERRLKIAGETLDIYAPIANRLGIGWLKAELEDLSLMHLDPDNYRMLAAQVQKVRDEKDRYISMVTKTLNEKLKEHNLTAEVTGRVKHVYSIYKKMKEQDLEFENIHDILAFRVLLKDASECYTTLGIIHSAWKPVPGRFKDYIALPKLNFYQSLHTVVVGPDGEMMEMQIRSEQMHRVAEYGIASHWKYKEGEGNAGKHENEFAWVRQLLEWQKELTDSYEFLDTVKIDLFPEDVFVFTPQGEIKVLPKGACPVDFAFAIHTDVGHGCIGARVNGRIAPLRQVLKNGDVVKIINSPSHTPERKWLDFVVTSRAKARIRQWLRSDDTEKSIDFGREIMEKEFKRYEIDYAELLSSGEIERVCKQEFSLTSVDNLLSAVGYGTISVSKILSKLLTPQQMMLKEHKVSALRKVWDRFRSSSTALPVGPGVLVKGVEDDSMVKYAKCCVPLPGDEIVGIMTSGEGVMVHARMCTSLLGISSERKLDVEWDKNASRVRNITIEVLCKDEKGVLVDISSAINDCDSNISGAEIKTRQDKKSVCVFEIGVRDAEHLRSIIRALQKIKQVIKVERVKSPEDN